MDLPRHARPAIPHLPDVRPLDRLRTIKIKLGVLVVTTNVIAVLITWAGLRYQLGPTRTFPLAMGISLVVTLLLARGMTSPLREMTAAVRAMAGGDYSARVRATSRDEVGQLAVAFNSMATELAQGDQERRELIANVSHELRTPVAALHAQLENLVDEVTEPTTANLEVALAQTERLTRLVSYLLDLSRIEAGAAALHVRSLGLQDFLDDVVDSVLMVEAGKQLHYEVDVVPADLTVPADRERLRQIVTNLLQNAIRHSPFAGTVRLVARRDGESVTIDVVDAGPGIAAADRERVFERFERGNSPAQTGASTGGTGIGLAIVRWAVSLHGGTVRVAEAPVGTTMRVTLPAPIVAAFETAPGEPDETPPTPPARPSRHAPDRREGAAPTDRSAQTPPRGVPRAPHAPDVG
ncbi:MAG: sensor histidine kinase [Cellulomonadaceae bacterium]